MANSQPYVYPFPFQYPPPQDPSQNPQPAPPGASSHSRHSSMSENFHFNGNLPGLSVQSFASPSQVNQQSHWPPPVPPGLFYGAGSATPALPTSQLPPNLGYMPPPPMPPPANVSASAPTPTHPYPRGATADRMNDLAESDREEGEWSESDASMRMPPASSIMHNQIIPRSITRGSLESSHASSTHPPWGDNRTPVHDRDGPLAHALPDVLANLSQRRREAEDFISLLNNNGIGYSALAKEDLDLPSLRNMYERLDLLPKTSSAQHTPAPPVMVQQNGPTSHRSLDQKRPVIGDPKGIQEKSLSAIKTKVLPSPQEKALASPKDRKEDRKEDQKDDRRDYIARLQAAKAAKQAVKVTTPKEIPPPTTTPLHPIPQKPHPLPNKPSNAPSGVDTSEEARARKNELLKQRLAVLTAQQRKEASRPATPQGLPTTAASTSTPNVETASTVPSNGRAALSESSTVVTATANKLPPTPSFTGLPGLFMNSSPAPTPLAQQPKIQKQPTNGTGITSTVSRKRPVASDFDDSIPPRTGPIYTRPLGQSPHEYDSESMIIEVSESEGSDMDLDEDNDDDSSAVKSSSAVTLPTITRPHQQALRNLPPLSEFPSRPGSARPTSSTISTPPALRGSSDAIAAQAESLRKEKEILHLKLKIAEMTKKRKEKEALAKALASSTPNTPKDDQIRETTNDVEMSSAPLPPVLSNIESLQQTSQAEKHDVTPPNKQNSQDWKCKRRAEIQSKLQLLDNGLEGELQKLAQLQKEIEQVRAKNEQARRDREELVRELEDLGVDTEGMGDEDLRAEKEKIEQQLDGNVESIQQARTDRVPAEPSSALTEDVPPVSLTPENEAIAEVLPIDTNVNSGLQPTPAQPSADPVTLINGESSAPSNSGLPKTEGLEPPTPVDDGDDFYSPAPVTTSAQNGEDVQKRSPEVTAAASPSPSEEGEVDMSESSDEDDGEEYVPEAPHEPSVPVPMQLEVSQPVENSLSITSSSASSSSSESDSEDDEEMAIEDAYEIAEENTYEMIDEDAYEPPEVDQPPTIPSVDGGVNGFTNNDHDEYDPAEMDISYSPAEASSIQSFSAHPGGPSESLDDGAYSPAPAMNNTAVELQSQAIAVTGEDVAGANEVLHLPQFVPYESPLKKFKSYRYHPNFTQEVSGGFLSLTYSHQIDPMIPLCRFESMGGSCNDPHCHDQHYRTMNLTDDKVLVELGTSNPGTTDEDRQRWNEGLRAVLKELRQNNIKDPNGIAVEISKFRRQFFNDEFRVVTGHYLTTHARAN